MEAYEFPRWQGFGRKEDLAKKEPKDAFPPANVVGTIGRILHCTDNGVGLAHKSRGLFTKELISNPIVLEKGEPEEDYDEKFAIVCVLMGRRSATVSITEFQTSQEGKRLLFNSTTSHKGEFEPNGEWSERSQAFNEALGKIAAAQEIGRVGGGGVRS